MIAFFREWKSFCSAGAGPSLVRIRMRARGKVIGLLEKSLAAVLLQKLLLT